MNLKKEQFVNLHGHSCFSLFDGFGFPQEHMDFAHGNGSKALALTDHGSMNGLSYQLLRAKEMQDETYHAMWRDKLIELSKNIDKKREYHSTMDLEKAKKRGEA